MRYPTVAQSRPYARGDTRSLKTLVSDNMSFIERIPPEIMSSDIELQKAAFMSNPRLASDALRADRDLVTLAVQSHGEVLAWASEDL